MLDRRTLLHFAAGTALLAGLPGRVFARPAVVDGDFPRQVEHVVGSTLIPRQPQRVAVISTGQLDAALSLGVIPAGTTRVDNRELAPGYLRTALASRAQELEAMVDLGSRQAPDLEALARLAPDLIVLNRTVLKAGGLELFSRIAPTVVARGTGGNWRPDFLLLADALGRRQQAERLLAELDSDLTGLAQRFGAQPPSASLLFSSGARLRLMGADSFAGGLLQAMGVTRPAAQRFKGTSRDVSAELLDLADADCLFYAEQGTALASLARQPLWPRLSAVSQSRAIRVDTDAFYLNAGPLAARQVISTVAGALGVT